MMGTTCREKMAGVSAAAVGEEEGRGAAVAVAGELTGDRDGLGGQPAGVVL
jgi:hypothetical protein